jgi:hypothetical protein
MSWGVGLRTGVALGLGNVVSFFSGYGREKETRVLITESGNNLVQEDGSLILA